MSAGGAGGAGARPPGGGRAREGERGPGGVQRAESREDPRVEVTIDLCSIVGTMDAVVGASHE
jgi:hypothetical protein